MSNVIKYSESNIPAALVDAYERGKGEGFDAGFDTAGREERRFTAAVAVMQGLLASMPANVGKYNPIGFAQQAVACADALLAELAKGEK